MLNMEYPFSISNHMIELNPHVMLEKRTDILRKMAESFDYTEYVKNSKQKIMENCNEQVADLFKKMFCANPDKRITFS